MAHEITERSDGTAEAAFALQPAWHGLGVVLDHPMTGAEGLTTAQLDWPVEQRPVAIARMAETWDKAVDWKRLPDHLANIRGDNGKFLGMVSDHYQVVQNVEAFSFLDELIENEEMQYESAFSLRGGKQVVLLGRLPKIDTIAEGDDLKRYVLLSLSHDGKTAIRFGPTSVRTVCANTYSLAEKLGGIKDLAISHKGNIKDKLTRARNILGMANQGFDRYTTVGRELAQTRFSAGEWLRFLDVMCPEISPDDPDYTERRARRIVETRVAIAEAYRNDRQRLQGIEETAWAAYNAVAEHIDHLPRRGATRERKAEARFNVNLYGVGRDMKQRALQAACRVAGIERTAA